MLIERSPGIVFSSMPKRRPPTLLILSLVMVVNALAYGMIIPLLYPYAARFGINAMGLSWLFASFSLAQFLSTPVLGRLSDRFGRKPVLLWCLMGTSASLALFAAATSVPLLFVARIIDGITGGNISVAQAIIADKSTGADRAKNFGLLGASFGTGFLVGPALGGLLSEISLAAPFWFASALALVGAMVGWFVLEETLDPKAKRVQRHEPLFQFGTTFKALFSPTVGVVLLIGLLAATAGNGYYIGFQSYTVDVLKLSTRNVGLLFALSGLVNILAQAVGIRWLFSVVKSKKFILVTSLILTSVMMAVTSLAMSFWSFAAMMLVFMIVNAPQLPVLGTLLSERTKPEDQGAMLGINQSYQSIGQVIGPLLAGVVATQHPSLVFVLCAGIFGVAVIASRWLFVPLRGKANL